MSRKYAPTQCNSFKCGFLLHGTLNDVTSKTARHFRHCKICTNKTHITESILSNSQSSKLYQYDSKGKPILSAVEIEVWQPTLESPSPWMKSHPNHKLIKWIMYQTMELHQSHPKIYDKYADFDVLGSKSNLELIHLSKTLDSLIQTTIYK